MSYCLIFVSGLGAEKETEKKLLETLHVESLSCLHEKMHKVTKRLVQTALSIASRMYVDKSEFRSPILALWAFIWIYFHFHAYFMYLFSCI